MEFSAQRYVYQDTLRDVRGILIEGVICINEWSLWVHWSICRHQKTMCLREAEVEIRSMCRGTFRTTVQHNQD